MGSSSWKADNEHASDYREAFIRHSPSDIKDVRGAMADDVRKDLRAVHWRHGFKSSPWESEAEYRSRSAGAGGAPAKAIPQKVNKTQFKLGNSRTEYVSDAKSGLKNFAKSDVDAARGVMSEAVRKDLRAVHVFAPRGKSAWSSDAMNIGRDAQNCVAPERHTKDLRSSNIFFGAEELGWISDAKDGLRAFSSRDMSVARGAMTEDARRDLRAVHFVLGTDRGILDRDIKDRYPHRRRPQSALR